MTCEVTLLAGTDEPCGRWVDSFASNRSASEPGLVGMVSRASYIRDTTPGISPRSPHNTPSWTDAPDRMSTGTSSPTASASQNAASA